jgi:hypothetical protein
LVPRNTAQDGDVLVAVPGTATSVSTATSTNTGTGIAYGHPPIGSINGLQAALDGKEPSLNPATVGYVLLGGASTSVATVTTTSTSTAKTWARIPLATTTGYGLASIAAANPQPLGVASPGTSVALSRGDHVHPLPGTATPTPGEIPWADGSGTLNAWVTHQVRRIGSNALSATVSSDIVGSWTTFISFYTSGQAGALTASGALGLSGNGDSCHARIALDGTQMGGEVIGAPGSASGWVALSPIGFAMFATGTHLVELQVASTNGSQCTALVSGSINRGNLVVTEYTN